MSQLLFAGDALRSLRERLLASDLERGALLLAQPVSVASDSWRLLATETVFLEDQEYSRQSADGLEIPPHILARLIKRARYERQSIVLVHTHPWDGAIDPSPVDRAGETLLLPVMFSRVVGLPHARLILGRKDTHAALFERVDSEVGLDVTGIGASLAYAPTLRSEGELDRAFDRQVRAFGELGQRRLGRIRSAIVGLGGTGSIVALQLAHLGVSRFLLIDPDSIDRTSLNRVAGATEADVGSAKVQVAARTIRQVSPAAEVFTLQEDVVRQSIARSILGTDFFFSCTDSHGSRAVLTQLAYQYLLPGIDLGVRIEAVEGAVTHVVGRVQMLAPGLACTSCTGVLDPEAVRRDLLSDEQRRADPYIVGGIEPQPSVISLNSVVSGLAVSMFLAAVTGVPLRARHQIVLFDSGAVKPIANTPDPVCPVCSERGFLGRGDSWPMPGRPDPNPGILPVSDDGDK